MKYTKKIGKNSYITFEDKDLPSFGINSLGDFIITWIEMVLGVFIGLGLIFGLPMLIGFIFG